MYLFYFHLFLQNSIQGSNIWNRYPKSQNREPKSQNHYLKCNSPKHIQSLDCVASAARFKPILFGPFVRRFILMAKYCSILKGIVFTQRDNI